MVGVLVLLSAFQFIDRRFHRHHRIFELINPNFALKVPNKNKIIILNITLRLFSRSAKHFLFFGFWKRITTILLKFAFSYFLKTQRNKSKNIKTENLDFFVFKHFMFGKLRNYRKKTKTETKNQCFSCFCSFVFILFFFVFTFVQNDFQSE